MTSQDNSSTLRACVFIDSSNPEFPNQIMNHSSHPFIKPPFPPLIDPKDLLIISKDNKPSRSPNAFIIYRKVFLKTTRDQGYFLPMTIVSSMASKSWDQESDEVRDYYKRLAKDAYKYRTEKFPKKVKRRRKKEPWNSSIAFQNDLHNTFFDNSNKSSSPELLPTENVFSQNSSPNLEQQIHETSLFNEPDFQSLFSSPNLSNNSSIISSPEITVIDNTESLLNYNYNSQNTEFNLHDDLNQINIESYDQNFTNLLNQELILNNNFPDYIPFNGNTFSNTSNQIDYNSMDSTVECLTMYPDLLNLTQQYQDVLGINMNGNTIYM
ncbi:hypothetical protein C1645_833835 [Glomus cerebriforme]|uniref:HMG box domain-containing protein n=1 Tax=Glomus cerebriforme TaxID=658196 RepID=A0A397SFF4_9GLOM|nr:hypothetical protein C1645_833835 [Glomus cerebriforme]